MKEDQQQRLRSEQTTSRQPVSSIYRGAKQTNSAEQLRMVYYNKFAQTSSGGVAHHTPEHQLTTLRRTNSGEQDEQFQVVSIIKLENQAAVRQSRGPFRDSTQKYSPKDELSTLKQHDMRDTLHDSHKSLPREIRDVIELERSCSGTAKGKRMNGLIGLPTSLQTISKDQKTGTDNEASYQVVMNELKNFQSFAHENTVSHSNLDKERLPIRAEKRRSSAGISEPDSVKTVPATRTSLENQPKLSLSYFRPLVRIEQASNENMDFNKVQSKQLAQKLQLRTTKNQVKVQAKSGKIVQAYARIMHTIDDQFQVRLLNLESLIVLHAQLSQYVTGRSHTIRDARYQSMARPKARAELTRTPLMPRPLSSMEQSFRQHNTQFNRQKSILLDFYLRLPYIGNSANKDIHVSDETQHLFTFRYKDLIMNPGQNANSALQLIRLADLEANLHRIVPTHLVTTGEGFADTDKIAVEDMDPTPDVSESTQSITHNMASKKEVLLLIKQPTDGSEEMSEQHSPMRSISVKNSFVNLHLLKEGQQEPNVHTIEHILNGLEKSPEKGSEGYSTKSYHDQKGNQKQTQSTSPERTSMSNFAENLHQSTLTLKSDKRMVYPTKNQRIVLKDRLRSRQHVQSSYIERKSAAPTSIIQNRLLNKDSEFGSKNNSYFPVYHHKIKRPTTQQAQYSDQRERGAFHSVNVSSNDFMLGQKLEYAQPSEKTRIFILKDATHQSMPTKHGSFRNSLVERSIETLVPGDGPMHTGQEQNLVDRCLQSQSKKASEHQRPLWIVSTSKKGIRSQSQYKMSNQRGGQFTKPKHVTATYKVKNLARWFSNNSNHSKLKDTRDHSDDCDVEQSFPSYAVPLRKKRDSSRARHNKTLLSFTNSQCVPMKQFDIASNLSKPQRHHRTAIRGRKIDGQKVGGPKSAFGTGIVKIPEQVVLPLSDKRTEQSAQHSTPRTNEIPQADFENQLIRSQNENNGTSQAIIESVDVQIFVKRVVKDQSTLKKQQQSSGSNEKTSEKQVFSLQKDTIELTVNKMHMSYRSASSKRATTSCAGSSSIGPNGGAKKHAMLSGRNADLPLPLHLKLKKTPEQDKKQASTAKGSSIKLVGSPAMLTEKSTEKQDKEAALPPSQRLLELSNSRTHIYRDRPLQQVINKEEKAPTRNGPKPFTHSDEKKSATSTEGHLVELLTKNDAEKSGEAASQHEKTRVFRRVASSISQFVNDDISTRKNQISAMEIAKNETTIEEVLTTAIPRCNFMKGTNNESQTITYDDSIDQVQSGARGFSAKAYKGRKPLETTVITLQQMDNPSKELKKGKFISHLYTTKKKQNTMNNDKNLILQADFPALKSSEARCSARIKKSRANTTVIAQRISVAGLRKSNESDTVKVHSPHVETAYADSSVLLDGNVGFNRTASLRIVDPSTQLRSLHPSVPNSTKVLKQSGGSVVMVSSPYADGDSKKEESPDGPAGEKQSMQGIDDGFVGQPIYETQEALTKSDLKRIYNTSEQNTASNKKAERKKRVFTPSSQVPQIYLKQSARQSSTVQDATESSANKCVNNGMQRKHSNPQLKGKPSVELSAAGKSRTTEPSLMSQEKGQITAKKFTMNRSRQSFEVTPSPEKHSNLPGHFSPFIAPDTANKRGASKTNFASVVNRVVEETVSLEQTVKPSHAASSEQGKKSPKQPRGDYHDISIKEPMGIQMQRLNSRQPDSHKVLSVSTEHDKKSSLRSDPIASVLVSQGKNSQSTFTQRNTMNRASSSAKPAIEVMQRPESALNMVDTLINDEISDDKIKINHVVKGVDAGETNIIGPGPNDGTNINFEEYGTQASINQRPLMVDAGEQTFYRRPYTSQGTNELMSDIESDKASQLAMTRVQKKLIERVVNPPMIIQSISTTHPEQKYEHVRPRMCLADSAQRFSAASAHRRATTKEMRAQQLLRRNMSVHRRQVSMLAQQAAQRQSMGTGFCDSYPSRSRDGSIISSTYGGSARGSIKRPQTQQAHHAFAPVKSQQRRQKTVVLIPSV